MKTGNLYKSVPGAQPQELLELLAEDRKGPVRVERIISHGHYSPEGYWYDQEQHEWVVLLKGAARLKFEEGDEIVELKPGDYVNLPAGCRHRVEWTTETEPTVWLAVHYG